MDQMFKIIQAWTKVFLKITNETHRERAEICNKCPLARYRSYVDFVDDELISVKGFVCTSCNCPIVSKVRSNDKCPLGKW
tara:strand:- start:19465 stop:19704 length:240 start_codon:yes stop_codon:yes gene_type:complete